MSLAAAGLALSLAAQARSPAPPLPAAASAVIARRFPTLHVLSHAVGALHADGARDVVVVLGRGERGARLVAVLWSEGDGVRFADASGDIAAACPSCDVAVRIVDPAHDPAHQRQLEVSTSDPGDAVASVRSWRFAYRGPKGDVLRLVGVRNERISHDSGDGAAIVDNVASADLLTGAKRDVIDGDSHGRRRHLEAVSRVPLRQPIAFGQFSFDLKPGAAETRFAFGPDFERR